MGVTVGVRLGVRVGVGVGVGVGVTVGVRAPRVDTTGLTGPEKLDTSDAHHTLSVLPDSSMVLVVRVRVSGW